MALSLDWAREAVEPRASVPMVPTNSWRFVVFAWVVMLGFCFIIVCERMSIGRCCIQSRAYRKISLSQPAMSERVEELWAASFFPH